MIKGSLSQSTKTAIAPLDATSRAVASPMPEAAPVIKTTLPVRVDKRNDLYVEKK
jgi:hypothetical protein